MKQAFSLIELLVIIAIIGIFSTFTFTILRGTVESAKANTIVTDLRAIKQAFEFKALDENISEWWHEDEFPSGPEDWERYVDLFVDQGIISDFLPVAPDTPDYAASPIAPSKYFYDNDKDWSTPHEFVDPADCHAATEANRRNAWDGVNIQFDIGLPYTDPVWIQTADELDQAIDGGDGYYCGSFRADNRTQSRFFFSIDKDQIPNF